MRKGEKATAIEFWEIGRRKDDDGESDADKPRSGPASTATPRISRQFASRRAIRNPLVHRGLRAGAQSDSHGQMEATCRISMSLIATFSSCWT